MSTSFCWGLTCRNLNIARTRTSELFIYQAVAQFFGRLIVCKLVDIKWINKFYFYQCSNAANGIFFLLAPLARAYVHLTLVFTAMGTLDAMFWAPLPLLVLDCVGPISINRAWGYFHAAINLSSAGGPPIAGLNVILFVHVCTIFFLVY